MREVGEVLEQPRKVHESYFRLIEYTLKSLHRFLDDLILFKYLYVILEKTYF